MRRIYVLLGAALIGVALCGAAFGQMSNTEWPKFQRTLGNVGYAHAPGPAAWTVKWQFNWPEASMGAPSVDVDGTIYWCASWPGFGCLAIDPETGAQKWLSDNFGDALVSQSPLVSDMDLQADGTVYIPCRNRVAALLKNDGSTKFETSLLGLGAIQLTTASDGTILTFGWNDGIYALRDDGGVATLLWKAAEGGDCRSAPAITTLNDEEVVVWGSRWGNVYGHAVVDGFKIFEQPIGGAVDMATVIDAGKNMYSGGTDGDVVSFHYDEDTMSTVENWRYRVGLNEWPISACLSADESTLYVMTVVDEGNPETGKLYALYTADGSEKWVYDTGAKGWDMDHGQPVCSETGLIVVSTDNTGKVMCIHDNDSGMRAVPELMWEVQSDRSVMSTACMLPNGVTYLGIDYVDPQFAGTEGALYALNPTVVAENPPGTMNEGWNWISVPVDPINPEPSAVLGGIARNNLTRWNRQLKTFELYPDDFGALEVGDGYIFKVALGLGEIQTSFLGVPRQGTQDIWLPDPGWSLIGHPFLDPVAIDDLLVKKMGINVILQNRLDSAADIANLVYANCHGVQNNEGNVAEHHSKFHWLYLDYPGVPSGYYYCWWYPDPGTTGWNMAGKLGQFDFYFDADDSRPDNMAGTAIFIRLYSGFFDQESQAWVITGRETHFCPVPIDEKWIHKEFIVGQGEEIIGLNGYDYDPTQIFYLRWDGCSWGYREGDVDRVGIDNLIFGDPPQVRTPVQDRTAPDPWINWNFIYWDSVFDTPKIATLSGLGGEDDMLRPWHGYLVWGNIGHDNIHLLVPQPPG